MKTTDEKIKMLRNWIEHYSWNENEERTDALFKVEVRPADEVRNLQEDFAELTKNDFIAFVRSLCDERSETYSIDSLGIVLDGDTHDTSVSITADIHLAD